MRKIIQKKRKDLYKNQLFLANFNADIRNTIDKKWSVGLFFFAFLVFRSFYFLTIGCLFLFFFFPAFFCV